MSVRSYQHGNPYPLDSEKTYSGIREYPFMEISISNVGKEENELSKIMTDINKTIFNVNSGKIPQAK